MSVAHERQMTQYALVCHYALDIIVELILFGDN